MLSSSTDIWSRVQTTLNVGVPSTLLANAFGNIAGSSPATTSNTAPSWAGQPVGWRQPSFEKSGSGSSRSSSASSNAEGPSQVLDASGQTRPTRPPRPPGVSRRAAPGTDRGRDDVGQFRGETGPVNERPSSASSASSEDLDLFVGSPPELRPGRGSQGPRPSARIAGDGRVSHLTVSSPAASFDGGSVRDGLALPAHASDGSTSSTILPNVIRPCADSGSSSLPSGLVGVAGALCGALQDTLELKYGVAVDVTDFVRTVEGHCTGDALLRDRREDDTMLYDGALMPGQFRSALGELVAKLNSSRDLRFHARDTDTLFALRIDFAECESFEELLSEVRRVPGTARSVAVVSVPASETVLSGGDVIPTPGSSAALLASEKLKGSASAASAALASGTARRSQAVAVFRTEYGDPTMLVGRCRFKGLAPLVPFRQDAFQGGAVIDPTITSVFCRDDAGVFEATECSEALEVLPLRNEYVATVGIVSGGKTASSSKSSWRELPEARIPEASSEGSGPAPGQRWMRRLRKALDHTDVCAESLLALLQQLQCWLEGSADIAAAARRAFTDASLQGPLVNYLQRACAAGGRWRTELAVASQACRIIGLASRDFPEGASAFFHARAASTLCGLMRRWLSNGDVQLGAVFALRLLLEEDPHGPVTDLPEVSKATRQQAAQQTQQVVRAAMATHPQLVELINDGSVVLQLLSVPHRESEEAPADGSPASSMTGRKGIASALMERRAADAAKPGMVSAAVGWLFSGTNEWNQKSPLKGASELPHGRSGHMAPPPEPLVPLPPYSSASSATVASIADSAGVCAVGALGLPAAAAAASATTPSPVAAMLADGEVGGGAVTPSSNPVESGAAAGVGVVGGASVPSGSTAGFALESATLIRPVVRSPPAFAGTTDGSEPLSPSGSSHSHEDKEDVNGLRGHGESA